MLKNATYEQARDLLLSLVSAVEAETLPLSQCTGRVLAQDILARENVPSFDRSPYDGYAVRSEDTASATREAPVTLRILEEIPAGALPNRKLTAGTCAKVLTGAPIPPGGDAVIMFEKTSFTAETVTLFSPLRAGSNIVPVGEDIRKGAVIARRGTAIDPGLAGSLGAQGEIFPRVFRKPRVALIATGNELTEGDVPPEEGKIRNSNRYLMEAVLHQLGCEPVYLGIAGDRVEDIAEKLWQGLSQWDCVITTGGVSVGDYDVTPAAMETVGAELLIRGVAMKPGMACAYGQKDGKLLCGLSGNPASALTNFYAVALPAIRKLAGQKDWIPQEIQVRLSHGFPKSGSVPRFLRGKMEIKNGTVYMALPHSQGNAVLSSAVEWNMMAVVPADSGPLDAHTVLKGFLL